MIRMLMMVATVLLSCTDPADVEWADRYELTLFGGASLPADWPSDVLIPPDSTSELVVRSGDFVVRQDGSCRRTLRADVPDGPLGPEALDHESWWECAWTLHADTMALTWVAASEGAIPLLASHVTVRTGDAELTLDFDTGIRCVRAPCPSGWSEVYEKVDGTPP